MVERLGSKLILFAFAMAFTIFAYTQKKGAEVKGDPSWSLVLLKDAKAPQRQIAETRARLAVQPLDQGSLNLLFASETKAGIDDKRRAAFVKALIALGWRNTPAQQNLMIELLQSDNPSRAILRADGLLRRGKLVGEVVPVLVRMELFPDATDILVDRLSRRPNWRKDYFAYAAPVPGEAGLKGRARLIERLSTRGGRLSHEELAPSLGMMVRGDMPETAIRLAGNVPQGQILYDPTFAKAASLPIEEQEKPLPFEWELASVSGVSGMIVARDAPQAQLRWNGRGAPVIARTMTLLRDPRKLALSIAVDSADALENLGSLAFSLQCRGAPPVRFSATGTDNKSNVARYVSEKAPPCSYPDFVISGHPQSQNHAIETTINAIHLQAV